VNEDWAAFVGSLKKIEESRCPTRNHTTNGSAKNSANSFDISSFKALRLHVQTHVKITNRNSFFIFRQQENLLHF
jgi:hypothetical protein